MIKSFKKTASIVVVLAILMSVCAVCFGTFGMSVSAETTTKQSYFGQDDVILYDFNNETGITETRDVTDALTYVDGGNGNKYAQVKHSTSSGWANIRLGKTANEVMASRTDASTSYKLKSGVTYCVTLKMAVPVGTTTKSKLSDTRTVNLFATNSNGSAAGDIATAYVKYSDLGYVASDTEGTNEVKELTWKTVSFTTSSAKDDTYLHIRVNGSSNVLFDDIQVEALPEYSEGKVTYDFEDITTLSSTDLRYATASIQTVDGSKVLYTQNGSMSVRLNSPMNGKYKLNAGTEYKVTFKYKFATETEKFVFGMNRFYSGSIYDNAATYATCGADMNNNFYTHDASKAVADANGWYTATVKFTAPDLSDGKHFLAIRNGASGTSSPVYFDDITIQPVTYDQYDDMTYDFDDGTGITYVRDTSGAYIDDGKGGKYFKSTAVASSNNSNNRFRIGCNPDAAWNGDKANTASSYKLTKGKVYEISFDLAFEAGTVAKSATISAFASNASGGAIADSTFTALKLADWGFVDNTVAEMTEFKRVTYKFTCNWDTGSILHMNVNCGFNETSPVKYVFIDNLRVRVVDTTLKEEGEYTFNFIKDADGSSALTGNLLFNNADGAGFQNIQTATTDANRTYSFVVDQAVIDAGEVTLGANVQFNTTTNKTGGTNKVNFATVFENTAGGVVIGAGGSANKNGNTVFHTAASRPFTKLFDPDCAEILSADGVLKADAEKTYVITVKFKVGMTGGVQRYNEVAIGYEYIDGSDVKVKAFNTQYGDVTTKLENGLGWNYATAIVKGSQYSGRDIVIIADSSDGKANTLIDEVNVKVFSGETEGKSIAVSLNKDTKEVVSAGIVNNGTVVGTAKPDTMVNAWGEQGTNITGGTIDQNGNVVTTIAGNVVYCNFGNWTATFPTLQMDAKTDINKYSGAQGSVVLKDSGDAEHGMVAELTTKSDQAYISVPGLKLTTDKIGTRFYVSFDIKTVSTSKTSPIRLQGMRCAGIENVLDNGGKAVFKESDYTGGAEAADLRYKVPVDGSWVSVGFAFTLTAADFPSGDSEIYAIFGPKACGTGSVFYIDNVRVMEIAPATDAYSVGTAAGDIKNSIRYEAGSGDNYQSAGIRFRGTLTNAQLEGATDIGFVVLPNALTTADWYKAENWATSGAKRVSAKNNVYASDDNGASYQLLLSGLTREGNANNDKALSTAMNAKMYVKTAEGYTYYDINTVSYEEIKLAYRQHAVVSPSEWAKY